MPEPNDGTPLGGADSVKDKTIEPDEVGTSDDPVKSTVTDEIDITRFSTGWTHTIQANSNELEVIDRHGNLVYGGPDAIGVTDATDFAEVFATIVNDFGDRPSVRLAPQENNEILYECKSTQTLDRGFGLRGAGRYINVLKTSTVDNSDIFTLSNPTDSTNILIIDNIKFTGKSGAGEPDRFFNIDGIGELQVTNTEFRDCNQYGIEATNTATWNVIFNSWFLAGAGFKMQGTPTNGGIHLVANKIANSATSTEVKDYPLVVESGTLYKNSAPDLTKSSIGEIRRFVEQPGGSIVATANPSGVSSVDITEGIDGDHKKYKIHITDFVPATDNVNLHVRVIVGGTAQSGASDYMYALKGLRADGIATSDSNTGTKQIFVNNNDNIGSAAGEGYSGTLTLNNPSDGSLYPTVGISGQYVTNTGEVAFSEGSGAYMTAEAIDGIRILFGTGNIESGTIEVEGIN